jgi:ER lumen protein retaining receptor
VTSLTSPLFLSSSTKYRRLAPAEVFLLTFGPPSRAQPPSLIGISFKSQALYVTVFITRYLDLFHTWVSFYNFIMKLFFIGSSVYILYLMKIRYRYVPSLAF